MPGQILGQTQQQRMQMVLSPQMQQALHILQTPILELKSVVQQELQTNPVLEEEEPDTAAEEAAEEAEEEVDEREVDRLEALMKLDEDWRDYFQQHSTIHERSSDEEEKREFMFNSQTKPQSLSEHLANQLVLSNLDEDERRIGLLLIGNINDDGYLTALTGDLATSTGYPVAQIEKVLAAIQEFDPPGVGARDIRECLLIQLRRSGRGDSLAAKMVEQYLSQLGAKKYSEIAREMNLTQDEVREIAREIARLEPKPGRACTAESANYVLPEVTVKKVNNDYIVIMNRDDLPHLCISTHYRRMLEDPNTPPNIRQYVKERIQAGAFLIKSIAQRQQTIFRIVTEIVRVQRDFFEHGLSAMRPLTMVEVAEQLGIHETTVSRAISGKYLICSRGTFEIKYFFTPGYATADGKEVSNKTIKSIVTQLVENEDPLHPYSDEEMMKILKERGVNVARRTIAKYRDALHILPSNLRKR